MMSTTAMAGFLLGVLRDGRVWSIGELVDQAAGEFELASAGTVGDAVEGLIEAGLAHQVGGGELVAASWAGMSGKAADPGDGHSLEVLESTGGIGVLEGPADGADELTGGAENLPPGLEPLGAPDGKGRLR